jgi:hypothetical protein
MFTEKHIDLHVKNSLLLFDEIREKCRSLKKKELNLECEVLTAVVMNNSVFWVIAACSPLKANRRFT